MTALFSSKRVALLLAAGESKRLGRAKQLVEFKGQPLICHAVDQALESGCDEVLVVTGAHRVEVEAALTGFDATQVYRVYHSGWKDGMGSSLAAGVREVESRLRLVESEKGFRVQVLLMLCDQPWIPVEHFAALFAEEAEVPVATAYPHDQVGVPAVVGLHDLPSLSALEGDRGAGRWLMERGAVGLACSEAQLDVDCPQDLSRDGIG